MTDRACLLCRGSWFGRPIALTTRESMHLILISIHVSCFRITLTFLPWILVLSFIKTCFLTRSNKELNIQKLKEGQDNEHLLCMNKSYRWRLAATYLMVAEINLLRVCVSTCVHECRSSRSVGRLFCWHMKEEQLRIQSISRQESSRGNKWIQSAKLIWE